MSPFTYRSASSCSRAVPCALTLALVTLVVATTGAQEYIAGARQGGRVEPPSPSGLVTAGARYGWIRPLASAAVPGSGQLLAGHDRGALYLVAETYLAARFLAEQREARFQAEHFRDLAFAVARQGFASAARDTAFGYFEEMGKFIESGPFDTDPGAPLVPPLDDRTFNGRIWRLARETFFQHPDSFPDAEAEEYQRALEFYRRRAVGAGFQWSWRGAALEHDLFRQSIRASDRAFRAATQHLGALLINHVLSAIDAFVSQRLAPNGQLVGFRSGVRSRGEAGHRPGFAAVIGFQAPF
ncbi:MAG TPA: hypothetical protein VF970_09510 [Gemmatimonadales bacterium]